MWVRASEFGFDLHIESACRMRADMAVGLLPSVDDKVGHLSAESFANSAALFEINVRF
jgi:hypothetical protein